METLMDKLMSEEMEKTLKNCDGFCSDEDMETDVGCMDDEIENPNTLTQNLSLESDATKYIFNECARHEIYLLDYLIECTNDRAVDLWMGDDDSDELSERTIGALSECKRLRSALVRMRNLRYDDIDLKLDESKVINYIKDYKNG